MALFGNDSESYQYEVERTSEGKILKIDCQKSIRAPSIESDALFMRTVVEKLIEVPDAIGMTFTQVQDYDYDFDQTRMLAEIAGVYSLLIRKKELFTMQSLSLGIAECQKIVPSRYNFLKTIVYKTLKEDPIAAYVLIVRETREVRIEREKRLSDNLIKCDDRYISILRYVADLLEKTSMITKVKDELEGYKVGDRALYDKLFTPVIKPNFMYTKLMAAYPEKGEEIGNYMVGDTEITIFKMPDSVQYLYHMVPPEFKLSEEKYTLLSSARDIMAEHKPTKEEFVEPERMREVFQHVGTDLLRELALNMNIKLTDAELQQLSEILVRYTIGFGLIEILNMDENIQDVSVNSPLGRIPIFVVHGEFGDCVTNIYPTVTESESWATKLRLISGRPLDEANPILDTELQMPGASTRVAAVTAPLNPTGLAFSFRRHRSKPWTLPLFINNKMINPLGAGLISFLIDGTKTFLVAGTRSSGKSSFLGSMLVELMRRYRMITVEDTLELPVPALRRLGYNVQSLKVSSALGVGETEVSAETGIRSTLRLGDSSLIIGEVRSTEAKALYEAMRVGAAANVVAGTIHAASPYGVFDRVVNDIGVPTTSFKASDIIIVANPIKTAGGLTRKRRVLQIAEVRKEWKSDPLEEKGFVDLMTYNTETDELEPTPDLINGDSDMLKDVASRIKQFAGNWDAVWDNILLRAKVKKAIVDYANAAKDPDMMEAEFVTRANDVFHNLSEQSVIEKEMLDSKYIYSEFERWLKKEVRLRQQKK
ncbi:type II/IV secretion system ATPase subunit [Candidatus Woesearchaeota archaeon]|nr:type II/IV secretion system ATPase subunit [Candidatus Woesearchaeota archaeon]